MLLYGDGMLVREDGTIIGPYPTEEFSLERLAYRCIICQPAAFFRRSFWEEVGPLEISLQYTMDIDYWIRAGKALQYHPEWRFAHVPQVFAYSRMHKQAKTLDRHEAVLNEIMGVMKKHFGYVTFPWVYGIEEVHDPRYDGIFRKSPISIRLIAKSFMKWIWHNRTRPGHVVSFLVRIFFSPRKSWREMVERTRD